MSHESSFPLKALAALLTFFYFRFMGQSHGLRGNFMLALIIICGGILSYTVPILYNENYFYEILLVKILPEEPQASALGLSRSC